MIVYHFDLNRLVAQIRKLKTIGRAKGRRCKINLSFKLIDLGTGRSFPIILIRIRKYC